MAFGLGVLRLPPEHFWTMTPAELAAAWKAHGGGYAPPPDRASLAGLMMRFPDRGG